MANEVFPHDWDTRPGYHGYSRRSATQNYLVVMSCRGKQTPIIYCDTQMRSAQLYDLALWYLLEFTPLCAKPNWISAFEGLPGEPLTREKVEKQIPDIKAIYGKVFRDSGMTEAQVEDIRQERLQRMRALCAPAAQFDAPRSRNELNKASVKMRDWSVNKVGDLSFRITHEVESLCTFQRTTRFKESYFIAKEACRSLQEALDNMADELADAAPKQ